jgi:hypothetical protein
MEPLSKVAKTSPKKEYFYHLNGDRIEIIKQITSGYNFYDCRYNEKPYILRIITQDEQDAYIYNEEYFFELIKKNPNNFIKLNQFYKKPDKIIEHFYNTYLLYKLDSNYSLMNIFSQKENIYSDDKYKILSQIIDVFTEINYNGFVIQCIKLSTLFYNNGKLVLLGLPRIRQISHMISQDNHHKNVYLNIKDKILFDNDVIIYSYIMMYLLTNKKPIIHNNNIHIDKELYKPIEYNLMVRCLGRNPIMKPNIYELSKIISKLNNDEQVVPS